MGGLGEGTSFTDRRWYGAIKAGDWVGATSVLGFVQPEYDEDTDLRGDGCGRRRSGSRHTIRSIHAP